MREEMGLEPDVVCYTTVIHAYARKGNLDKCALGNGLEKMWELYRQCQEELPNVQVDEQLMSYMIKQCHRNHQPEKAIRMWNELQMHGFIEHVIPYNSIIAACASTKRTSR